jgi:ATP-binding cassette, subfamily C (CFTR/MRP), member 10
LVITVQVLCLDECTANIDNQTASLLQNTISTECKDMTVLTIAHRISTVMKMDNILVLDQGKLVRKMLLFLPFWNTSDEKAWRINYQGTMTC